MTLQIDPEISARDQHALVRGFNVTIDTYRAKYHSLFLCNFREGGRKRISFDLVYRIMGNLLLRIDA
jgi:hypothetical protein